MISHLIELKTKLWRKLKSQSWHWWTALAITFLALFLRLYRLPSTVMFQGDQGRDALVVSRIFTERDLVFIGPVTSVGNMYLGPFYYYFMLPFLWLSYPSPLGPVYAVAVFSSAAVFLLYLIGKKIFNFQVGLLASFFFALSSTAVDLSRFSWNPNLAPLVSILLIYFNWRALRKPKNWLGVAVCASILIQLHYLTLLAVGSAGLLWIYQLIVLLKQRKRRPRNGSSSRLLQKFLIYTGLSGLIGLLSITPLVLFDLKHGGVNTSAFVDMFTSRQNFATAQNIDWLSKLWKIVKETEGRAMHILFEFTYGKRRALNRLLTQIVLATLASLYLAPSLLSKLKQSTHFFKSKLYQYLSPDSQQGMLVIITYLAVGIVGTAIYQHTIFDHYIAYLFPVSFLVYAIVIDLFSKFILGKILAAIFIVSFLSFNLVRFSLQPNYSLQTTQKTAQQIVKTIPADKSYNIVLLSESKDIYGQSYRYFLSTLPHPPLKIGQHLEPDILVIIDELNQPQTALNNEIYEILVFPDKQIDRILKVKDGPQVYFLNKTQS